jgi:hypothetical protein
MADNLADDEVQKALAIARQPSNLVTEADLYQPSISETLYDIGAALPSAVSRYVSSVPERFSAATERVSQMSPSEIAQSVGASAKSMFVDPAVQMFTAPGRAYQGQIPQEQMLPEALNFAGMATLGGIPASYAERAPGVMLGTSGSRMVPEAAAVELAKRELTPLGFYSHGAESALALPQATGSVDQMIAMLRKQSGVTEAELRNAGLLTEDGRVNPDWLAKSKIGREDIASHLRSSMPQVEETILGGREPFDANRLKQLETEYSALEQHPIDDPSFGEEKYNELIRLMNIRDQSTTNSLYKAADEATFTAQRAQRIGDLKTAEKYFREAEFLNTRAEKLDLEGQGLKNPTKYGEYTLPGGANYREVLLRLPETPSKNVEKQKLEMEFLVTGRFPDRFPTREEAEQHVETLNRLHQEMPELGIQNYPINVVEQPIYTPEPESINENFRSPHWDDPNVLAHIRMADRTGPNGEKILHVEEVQSDWGQKGKKEGFAQNLDPKIFNELKENESLAASKIEDARNAFNDAYENIFRENVKNALKDSLTEYDLSNALQKSDEARKLMPLQKRFKEYRLDFLRQPDVFTPEQHQILQDAYDAHIEAKHNFNEARNKRAEYTSLFNGVPSAPYVTSTPGWTDLAMKRILKEAAEGGYDKVVWTPGAEQAQRYNLRNQIDELMARKNDNGTFQLSATLPGGGTHQIGQEIPAEKLADYVGKDMAEKIKNQEFKADVYSGDNLEVGGEGMKEYYDKILPKRLQEVAKRHDKSAKVGYTDVMLPPSGKRGSNNPPIQAPGLDITPQMRESILRGQGAFAEGGRTMGNNAVGNALRMARLSDNEIEMPHSLKELQAIKKLRPSKNTDMDSIFTSRMSGIEGAEPVAMPSDLDELLAYLRKRHSSGGRSRYDDGGDVRGGDSPFMSRSDYGLREAPTPSFRQAEDRSMREYERAVESGWSPTDDRGGGGGANTPSTSPESQLTGRQSGFEGAPSVAMPSSIGELLAYNRNVRMQQQQSQQQQQAEQEATDQKIRDALAMAGVGATKFGDTSILPSGFPPVEKQEVIWGGGLRETPAWAANKAVELSRMPNVMGLPAGTALARTEMPVQAEYYGAPQETPEQMFARGDFGPQINAQFASAGSPYAVTPSAPQTMFAGTQPAFPHTPTPQQVSQVASAPDVRASFVQPNRPITLTPQPTIEQLTQAAPQQVAQNVPLPPTVARDPIAAAVAAASAPVEVAEATDPLAQTPDALVLPGRKAAQTVPMPMARPTDLPQAGLFDKIRSDLNLATGQRINELEAANQYAGGSPEQVAAALGVSPDALKARIINQDGKQVVDYYTKDLMDALFGPKTQNQQVVDAVAAAREGVGGRDQQQATVAPATVEAAKPPFMTELSAGNLALPHVDGLTAQQWANANTGGDLSKVHARIVYRNGAPRLEYYAM